MNRIEKLKAIASLVRRLKAEKLTEGEMHYLWETIIPSALSNSLDDKDLPSPQDVRDMIGIHIQMFQEDDIADSEFDRILASNIGGCWDELSEEEQNMLGQAALDFHSIQREHAAAKQFQEIVSPHNPYFLENFKYETLSDPLVI